MSITLELDIEPDLPRVESALHGPAHPDEFRIKVGQYWDRFYHDPLPGCDLAPACEDTWPSVSTIKKASDRDWSWVSLERAAGYLEQRRHELDGLNAAEIHARLLEVNKAGLKRAGDRGTSIHGVMEALASGAPLPKITAEAEPYVPACRAFLDDHQPEWLFSEVVSINRAVGYGGTFDAIVRFGGGTYLVDWKTRKPGKQGAYADEAWQISAYANAEYIIIDNHGEAARQSVPALDGGYIVSIAPEGYRLYPVNLDGAWRPFQSLRTFWADKQLTVIGRPVRPPKAAKAPAEPPASDDLRAWIVDRLAALKANLGAARAMKEEWPEGVPGIRTEHRHTEAELDAIAAVLTDVEDRFSLPFPNGDPRVPPFTPTVLEVVPPLPLPDEGPDMGTEDVAGLRQRVDALPSETRAVLNSWAAEAHKAGRTFSIGLRPSKRRFEIYRACLELARFADDLDFVRAAIACVIPEAAMPAISLGAALGALTIDEALYLTDVAIGARARPGLDYGKDGSVRLLNLNHPNHQESSQS